jgi:voltage-gated potassium channel Kch
MTGQGAPTDLRGAVPGGPPDPRQRVEWVTGRDGRHMAMLGSTPVLSTSWELFIVGVTLLSVLNLALYVLPFLQVEVRVVVYVVDVALTVPLLMDFGIRYQRAPDRRAYLWSGRGWLDLVGSLPLPFLRILRLVRVRRITGPLGRRGIRSIIGTLLREPASGALLGVVLLTFIVMEAGSAIVLVIEEPAAGATITTPSDALWFSYETITTVGYGDVYPVTNAGRVVGVVVLTLGIALFGTFTGYVANAFLSPPGEEANEWSEPGGVAGRSRSSLATTWSTDPSTLAAGDAPDPASGPAGPSESPPAAPSDSPPATQTDPQPATRQDVETLRAELAELRAVIEAMAERSDHA